MGLDIDVGVKNSRVRSGLAQIRNEVGKFSGSIGGMLTSAFSVAGIVAFAGKMREVQKEAARFGASAETIQRVGKACKESDVDFDRLARSMGKVTLEATKAARGGEDQSKTFKALGIDAAKFVGMSLDQKILVLSRAFVDSRASGMKTAAMLDLLGEKGSEITPLLGQGPAKLAQTMNEATVQTNATVAAFARLDRQMEKLKGTGAKWLSTAIGSLRGAAAQVASVLNMGDYGDAAQTDLASENMRLKHAGKPQITGADAHEWTTNRMHELRQKDMDDGKQEADGPDNAAPAQPADDFTGDLKDKQLKSLKDGIAEDEARNRADALTGEAKLNELMQQRQELAGKIGDDTVAGLEAKKRDLALEHEIQQLQKAGEQRYKEAYDRRAEGMEKDYLAKASPAEKKKYLTEKQRRLRTEASAMDDRSRFEKPRADADTLDQEATDADAAGKRFTAEDKRARALGLRNQADEAEKHYDPAKAVEKRTEADGLQSEIDKADRSKGQGRLAVAVDSLQRAGGGGRAVAASDPAQRSRDQQTKLLQQIRDAVKQGSVSVGAAKEDTY